MIDGRKAEQRFKGVHGKDVYVHKLSKNNYAVGINGTSLHSTDLEKHKAETVLRTLLIKTQV